MTMNKVGQQMNISLMILASAFAGCATQTSTQTANDVEEEYYDSSLDGQQGAETAAPEEPVEEDITPSVLIRRAPRSSGGLDGDDAGRALFGYSDPITECYSRGGSSGSGVALIVLDVEPNGEISDALIGHSDVKNPVFIQCLDDLLQSMTLPESTGSSVVQAHLVFGAQSDEEGRALLEAYRDSRRAAEEQQRVAPSTEIRRIVQQCYERTFRGIDAPEGRFVLGLVIAEDGTVTRSEIVEDELEGRIDACVLGSVEGLQLDVEGDNTSVTHYPVVMHPTQGSAE